MSKINHQEELAHALVWQVLVIVTIIIISWIYIVPKYITLSQSVTETNNLITKYQDTEKNGIPYLKLMDLLSSKWKLELLGIIQSAPKETQTHIIKTSWDKYVTWLENEINKSNTDEQKLIIKKARLNSILPTLNPINNNQVQDTVNLKQFTYFIENKIIKQFGIEWMGTIGIQWIRYGKKWSSMPETIGSFDIDITFKSTNGQIIQMIDYFSTLWKYDILNETGVLINGWAPAVMSNPLAVIDALSLDSTLVPKQPDLKNWGTMTIRFYIRGSSLTDIAFLSEALKNKKETLKSKISIKLDACIWELTCPSKRKLEAVSRKFTELTRATDNIKRNPWMEIYGLTSEIESIMAIEKEFNSLIR